jgi:hypothetical protein
MLRVVEPDRKVFHGVNQLSQSGSNLNRRVVIPERGYRIVGGANCHENSGQVGVRLPVPHDDPACGVGICIQVCEP